MRKQNRNNRICTNEESGKTDFIIDPLLPIGKENAITTQELMRISGCGSSRELRQRIALERERGAIICSGSGRGYWKPKNRQEIQEFIKTMDARAWNRYQLHVLAVGIPDDNHVVDMRDTQVRLGKDSIGKGSINNNVGRKMSHFTPPTVEEVQEYCFERGNAVDAQSFVDFYTSKGWYVGKTKMKDWKASVRTWEKNQRQKNKKSKDDEGLEGWLNA